MSDHMVTRNSIHGHDAACQAYEAMADVVVSRWNSMSSRNDGFPDPFGVGVGIDERVRNPGESAA